ncbi:hypothetical protein [Arthrobacter sp. RIT-PI-e]|uniref:hypothetical protein n=1 Tax=Arthrobacter sp. RIT-PI-e TaxID=1681197 RepID=UPI0019108C63|nr:hypothetical protein [Arthrobacter sp. RIT-PI-e]
MARLAPPATDAVRESVTVVVEPVSMDCGEKRRPTEKRGLTIRSTRTEASGSTSSSTPT